MQDRGFGWHRARQFFRALLARVTQEEYSVVAQHLTPAGQALFRRMPRHDQRHSLDVLYTLQREGHTHPALMQAALLHDVAKGEAVRLWHRVAAVLIQAAKPEWLARLAGDGKGPWRRGFYVHLYHPAASAALARDAGCDPLAVELIAHHQAPVPEHWRGTLKGDLLNALKRADEQH